MKPVTKLRILLGGNSYVVPKEIAIALVDCGKADYDDENAPRPTKSKPTTRVFKSVNDSPAEEVTDG